MNETEFEKQLRSIAAEMEYPHTPNIAGSVIPRLRPSTRPRLFSRPFASAQGRLFAWSLTIVLILLSSLLLIPPARAAIIEFIQIGIVRIFPAQPPTAVPESFAPVTATPQALPLPTESSALITFLDQIAGETKLANAREIAGYPILLPTYPPNLGLPNHVYVQDANGVMTVLVWVNAQQPGHVTMSLHFIPEGTWMIEKFHPTVIEETEVNGRSAVWAVGSYPLMLRNGNMDFTRLMDGHVLIWVDGDITYRLETEFTIEEAVKIAESLQPIP